MNMSTKVHASAVEHTEGGLAKPIEEFTAKLPSDTFLWLAFGCMGVSLALRIMNRSKDAQFVGLWAPSILIMGLYNKLVKVAGHDQFDRDM